MSRDRQLEPPEGDPAPCLPLKTVRVYVAIAYMVGMAAAIGVVQIVVSWA